MNLFKKNNKKTEDNNTPNDITASQTASQVDDQPNHLPNDQDFKNQISYKEITTPEPPNSNVDVGQENSGSTMSSVAPHLADPGEVTYPEEVAQEINLTDEENITPHEDIHYEDEHDNLTLSSGNSEMIEEVTPQIEAEKDIIEPLDNNEVLSPVERLLEGDNDYQKPEQSLAQMSAEHNIQNYHDGKQTNDSVSDFDNKNTELSHEINPEVNKETESQLDHQHVNEQPVVSQPENTEFISMDKFTQIVERSSETIKQYQQENADLVNSVNKITEANSVLNQNLTSMRHENSGLKEEISGLKIDIRELEEELDKQDALVEALQKEQVINIQKINEANSVINEIKNRLDETERVISVAESKNMELVEKNRELENRDPNLEVSKTLQKLVTKIEEEGEEQRLAIQNEMKTMIKNAKLKAEEIELHSRIIAEEKKATSLDEVIAAHEKAKNLNEQAAENLANSTSAINNMSQEFIQQGQALISTAEAQAEAIVSDAQLRKNQLEVEVSELESRRNKLNGYTHNLLNKLKNLQNKIDEEIDPKLIPAVQLEAPKEDSSENELVSNNEQKQDVEPTDNIKEITPQLDVLEISNDTSTFGLENKDPQEPEIVNEIILEEDNNEEQAEEDVIITNSSNLEHQPEPKPEPEPEYEPVLEVNEEIILEEANDEQEEQVVTKKEEIITYNDLMKEQQEQSYEDPGE